MEHLTLQSGHSGAVHPNPLTPRTTKQPLLKPPPNVLRTQLTMLVTSLVKQPGACAVDCKTGWKFSFSKQNADLSPRIPSAACH